MCLDIAMRETLNLKVYLPDKKNKNFRFRVPVSPPFRYSFGLLPGAASSQHPLVSDQCHVVGRGSLPGLPLSTAGLRALSPLHEPRGRRARLPHSPQARRVWNLHDQHAGSVLSIFLHHLSSRLHSLVRRPFIAELVYFIGEIFLHWSPMIYSASVSA